MKTFVMVVTFGSICLFAHFEQAFGADDLANKYFGNIEIPCSETGNCDELTDLIKSATKGNECSRIEEHCPMGEAILKKIFGTTYRGTLADFIVYLEAVPIEHSEPTKYKLKKHSPLLMWQGENTPYLMGARSIYVMVFSQKKVVDIKATVTSDYQYDPNPLIGILSVLKAPEIKTGEEKSSVTSAGQFTWLPLSGNDDNTLMWLGITRIDLPPNSINRVTVYPPMLYTGSTPTTSNKIGASGKVGQPTEEASKPGKVATDKYEGDFLGVTGHFTNSPENYASFSLAVGATFHTKGTAIASGGSNINFNGYVFAKFYVPGCRPYLYATPHLTLYNPSIGLVVGTNTTGKSFSENIVGLSLGHLIGNVGMIMGENYLAGADGTNEGRKKHAFLALDYTF